MFVKIQREKGEATTLEVASVHALGNGSSKVELHLLDGDTRMVDLNEGEAGKSGSVIALYLLSQTGSTIDTIRRR